LPTADRQRLALRDEKSITASVTSGSPVQELPPDRPTAASSTLGGLIAKNAVPSDHRLALHRHDAWVLRAP
jgi:hypothetical protein